MLEHPKKKPQMLEFLLCKKNHGAHVQLTNASASTEIEEEW
jgi:hypothetical protein